MKKTLFLFIAGLAMMGFNSCQTDVTSGSIDKRFVGVWGLMIEGDAKQTYVQYMDIHEDGSVEILTPYAEDTKYYQCDLGHCSLRNNDLVLYVNESRIYFYWKKVMRIASFRKHLSIGQQWRVESVTADKIMMEGKKSCSLNRLAEKPDIWAPEFAQPQKEPTDDVLTAQWDMLNTFNLTETGFTWYAYVTPQYEGMQLTDKHEISAAFFWVKWLQRKMDKDGTLPAGKGLGIKSSTSNWVLERQYLHLTSSTYEIVSFDSEGNATDREEVTPATPLGEYFDIVSLTDQFMVLYSPTEDCYYVFTPGTPIQAAPKSVSASPNNN